jgi:hypothetical protein
LTLCKVAQNKLGLLTTTTRKDQPAPLKTHSAFDTTMSTWHCTKRYWPCHYHQKLSIFLILSILLSKHFIPPHLASTLGQPLQGSVVAPRCSSSSRKVSGLTCCERCSWRRCVWHCASLCRSVRMLLPTLPPSPCFPGLPCGLHGAPAAEPGSSPWPVVS